MERANVYRLYFKETVVTWYRKDIVSYCCLGATMHSKHSPLCMGQYKHFSGFMSIKKHLEMMRLCKTNFRV